MSTVELNTFQRCIGILNLAVRSHIIPLATELLAVGLITAENYSLLTNIKNDEVERAANLLSFVLTKIRLSARNYHVFVKVLISDRSTYKEVLKDLEPIYKEPSEEVEQPEATSGSANNNTFTLPAANEDEDTRLTKPGCCCNWLWFIAPCIIGFLIALVYLPPFMYHSKSLPYLSENFVGREQKIEEIMQLMDFRNSTVRIINIFGPPGFGKSTLAMHVGHAVVKRGDVVHYVNMADFPEKDVKLVLSGKVMDSAQVVAKQNSFETLQKRASEWYYNNLLILDNCDDVIHNQKEEFYDAVNKLVEESTRIKVIFTSRTLEPFLKYNHWVKINELSEVHAHKLLESILSSRVNITQEEMQQIAHYTGNVPLALRIIGSLLCLPFSPTPSRVIQELQMNPMKILTPEDFPASEQLFTTIHLSYTYLANETKKIGEQLTVFPGSFELYAAIVIVCKTDFALWFKCEEVLDRLVKSSLLEYDKRSQRYQYHQLIREYFLYVKRNNSHDAYEQLVPHFYMYYADMLMFISTQYSLRYGKSLAVLDSELHNIQCLLQNQSLPIKEFVVTVMSLSKGINVGLLSLRFSREELCSSIKIYSKVYDLKLLSLMILKGEGHHHDCSSLGQEINKETILAHYKLLIKLVAKCEEETHGTLAAS